MANENTTSQHKPGGFRQWTTIFLCSLISACTSIGPNTIPRDRFDYASAITESWKSQMLRNIVQLRYGEPPIFMDVASIINQYEFSGKIQAGALAKGGVTGSDVYSLSGNAGFIDRPTITYNPLTGKHFAQSLLSPIPPGSLFRLIQAGYPADFIFDIGARAINGIRNGSNIGILHQEGDPEFSQLLTSIRAIQIADASDIRVTKGDNGDTAVLFIPKNQSTNPSNDILMTRKILGLAKGEREFDLVFGLLPQHQNEIAILSRSMLEIMLELSADVEVPASHIAEGSTPGFPENQKTSRLLRVHSQVEPPADPFVAVEYRDHWFWIDNTDMQSKRVLTFLMVLFSLAETGAPAQLPVVTVGAGS